MSRASARSLMLSCGLVPALAACGVAPEDQVVRVRTPAARPLGSSMATAPSPGQAVASTPVVERTAGEAVSVAPVHAPAEVGQVDRAVELAVPEERPTARQRERALRGAFAGADLQTSSREALELAAFLVAAERHSEALHVLDLAVDAAPRASLLVGRAGVFRDLARSDLAWADLLSVVQSRGREGVAPGTLFELAQVEWLSGASADAQQTMRDLARLHTDSDWLAENAEDVRRWQQRIESREVAQDGGGMRDALALLRAAPRVTARLKMLDTLAQPAGGGADEGRRELRLLALGIACGDPAPAVRARAVQLADEHEVGDPAFWSAALQDPAPLVRRYGARGAGRILGRSAAPTLLAALGQEEDALAFERMNSALAIALSQAAPAGDFQDARTRARVREEWRSRCGG